MFQSLHGHEHSGKVMGNYNSEKNTWKGHGHLAKAASMLQSLCCLSILLLFGSNAKLKNSPGFQSGSGLTLKFQPRKRLLTLTAC